MMRFMKTGKVSIIIPILVATIVALGVFAYMQMNTETAYITLQPIQAGTRFTNTMIDEGIVQRVQIPKTMANNKTVNSLEITFGKYASHYISIGHPLNTTDIATKDEMRANPEMTTGKLEAIKIPVDQGTGLDANVNIGDRVNVYGIYTYDVEGVKQMVQEDTVGVQVNELSDDLKDIFIANDLSEDYTIGSDEISVSKLLLQNVSVVSVNKIEGELISVTLGVKPSSAELIHLTMKTGDLGLTLLPFSTDGYIEVETNGAISSLELKLTETYKKTISTEEETD